VCSKQETCNNAQDGQCGSGQGGLVHGGYRSGRLQSVFRSDDGCRLMLPFHCRVQWLKSQPIVTIRTLPRV
jgi:hypothetical protein